MRLTARQLQAGTLLALSLAAMAALVSCSKQPETQTATTTTETHTVHVSRVDLGQNLSADRRVVTTDAPSTPRTRCTPRSFSTRPSPRAR